MNDLHELIQDAASGVEPTDRLAAIQARTATPARRARPWWYAAGGVVVATAAAVTVVAVVSGGDPAHREHDHVMTDPPGTQLVAAYFVGDSPQGERLFREFDKVRDGDSLQAALDRIERPAIDPDYRTSWTATSFGEVTRDGDGIDVELGDADALPSDDLAMQQVVYTLQAAAGERLPVWFWRDGQRGDAPYTAAPENDVLNLVSIGDPAEGTAYVETQSFLARGRANSFEATVPWEVRDEAGDVVVSGFATATGQGDRLYPWKTQVDVSGLMPGFYEFVATTSDPSGGAEGNGVFTDTRTIIVR